MRPCEDRDHRGQCCEGGGGEPKLTAHHLYGGHSNRKPTPNVGAQQNRLIDERTSGASDNKPLVQIDTVTA